MLTDDIGEDPDILNREITAIQELLDEQPDSKCWSKMSLNRVFIADCGNTGCMESLVHYKRMLLRKHESSLDSAVKLALTEDCENLLLKLQTIDPSRRQRYIDLGEFVYWKDSSAITLISLFSVM